MDTNETPQGEVVEEAEVQEVTPEETQETLEPVEPIQEETEVEESEAPEEPAEEPKPSRRESLRIQQLIQKMKQPDEKAPEAPPVATGMDYSTALDADPTVLGQLEADRTQYGQAERQQGRQEAMETVKSIQFHTRLEIDAPKVESKYPVLDKDSSDFNPAVADAINNWYLATAGYNPQTDTVNNANVRYSDFVEGIMELADEMAGEKNTKTVQNVAKQAAATGLRPDGSKAKALNLNQNPENMTDEELKAVIAQAIPKQ